MMTQQEFAAAMKTRLAGEIGNLVISVIEAQTERDIARAALQKEAEAKAGAEPKPERT